MSKKTKTKEQEASFEADAAVAEPQEEQAQEVKATAAVATRPTSELEAYGIEGSVAPGTESMDRDDVVIPRIKVIQGMSVEATRENAPVALGSLHNNGTDETYVGPASRLRVIMLSMTKQRVLFAPKGHPEEGKLLYRSIEEGKTHDPNSPAGPRDDEIVTCAHCPDAQWGEQNEPPACGLQYIYPMLALDENGQWFREPGPMMLILGRTGVKTAKKVNGFAKWSNLPLFAFAIDIWTERRKNDNQQVFFVLQAERAEKMRPDDERFLYARNLYQSIAGKRIVVDYDEEDAGSEEGSAF